jgi:curved DNA-binding protein CbpA
MTDPYAVLGVSPTATQAEITHAFRDQLHALHPDTRSGAANSQADKRLRQIVAAHALLRDPHHRAEYDRHHRAEYDRTARRARRDTSSVRGPLRMTVKFGVRIL